MAEEIAVEYKPPISPPKSNNKFPVKMVSQFLLKIQKKVTYIYLVLSIIFYWGGGGEGARKMCLQPSTAQDEFFRGERH